MSESLRITMALMVSAAGVVMLDVKVRCKSTWLSER